MGDLATMRPSLHWDVHGMDYHHHDNDKGDNDKGGNDNR